MKVVKRAPNKVKVYEKVHSFLDKYTTILLCDIKDMPANNIHKMRKQLRAIDSEVLCGKTTVIDLAVNQYLQREKIPSFHNKEQLTELTNKLPNRQLCIIFTNRDISEITKISDQFKIEKQSKVGALSPVEVTLPAGPTGMDASQIEYFQNLRITTKVVRNQLEIINPTRILSVGQKITLSEINLMNRFNIKPFKHRIAVIFVYINGKLYDEGILNLNNDTMGKALSKGISNIAAFGLATSISNKASAPHVIANAFSNILGLSLGCKVEIKQAKGLQAAVSAAASAPVAAPKKEEPKKEEKKAPAKKQPEPDDDDDVGFGGLF
jgi:large subunit ribosomal protein LP0